MNVANRLAFRGRANWLCVAAIVWVVGDRAAAADAPAALIPAPRQVSWKSGEFALDRPLVIVLPPDADDAFEDVGRQLATVLIDLGSGAVTTSLAAPQASRPAELRLAYRDVPISRNDPEAYTLAVSADVVELSAPDAVGLFRGVQTLRQLASRSAIRACEIVDWPAFSMRGVMFDVGRNFISLPLLEKYIDVMALYKMNVFHFHLTEHIGWRLEIKSHPELTAPEHQIRRKGRFYTHSEIKALLEYCRKRHITVIPEIDMPGHSEAFVRATGHRMESAEGMAILADVLREVCDLFDAPYIHLGSDEVRIRNLEFIPTMAAIVRARGREVILWRPGGPYDKQTIYQMWHNGQHEPGDRVLDSRDIYVNHLDCFSGVLRVFHKKICDVELGSKDKLGAILCHWPDRNVANEQSIFTMSPLAPAILALAERAWRGGGYSELNQLMAEPGSPAHRAFVEFESRMLEHRDRFFADKPFTYVKQSNIVWDAFGPFPNDGDLEKVFPPEIEAKHQYEYDGKIYDAIEVRGASPFFGGWYDHGLFPGMKNRTAYVVTYAHVDRAMNAHMWIGFRNWARSHRDSTPKDGEWDHRKGRIWLNGTPIAPPKWAKPGRKGNAEEPLIDELYAVRAPTPVHLNAGWNKILIKAPVGGDATKWMCTAVLVSWDGDKVRALNDVKYATQPHSE